MATSREIINHINKLVQKKQQETLDKVCSEAQKQAQKSFNRVKPEVPADDPNVMVYKSPTFYVDDKTIGKQVICRGNQVLYIEFGAGIRHANEITTSADVYSEKNAWRPAGIYPLGYYLGRNNFRGQKSKQAVVNFAIKRGLTSLGMNDYWFYKSKTGRGSTNSEQIRFNFNNNSYTMITIGIRPVRALYLAIGLAIRKLLGGKL